MYSIVPIDTETIEVVRPSVPRGAKESQITYDTAVNAIQGLEEWIFIDAQMTYNMHWNPDSLPDDECLTGFDHIAAWMHKILTQSGVNVLPAGTPHPTAIGSAAWVNGVINLNKDNVFTTLFKHVTLFEEQDIIANKVCTSFIQLYIQHLFRPSTDPWTVINAKLEAMNQLIATAGPGLTPDVKVDTLDCFEAVMDTFADIAHVANAFACQDPKPLYVAVKDAIGQFRG